MKKILFILALACFQLTVNAQEKLTPEKAKLVMTNAMAVITNSVSFVYTKGITYEAFRKKLCGNTNPTKTGNDILEAAYHYLSKGYSTNEIIQDNNGRAVAAGLQFLLDAQEKGMETDDAGLFGSEKTLQQNEKNYSGKCRWYQLWCHVQALIDILLGDIINMYDMPFILAAFNTLP